MRIITLTSLIQLLEEKNLLSETRNLDTSSSDIWLDGCDCDSRHAAPNHIFVCKGQAFKPAYLTSAVQKGAVAFLCDEAHVDELSTLEPNVPCLVVSNLRTAMAECSVATWGHPDEAFNTIGITGTKGKSTVAYMLRSILDGSEPYKHTAILGSIDTFDGIENEESHNTTPEAPDLWRHLANAKRAGLEHLVMEVASQGLKYERVVGLNFDIAVFLNIGRDHISPVEHSDFDDYFQSKLKIFDACKTAVVNLDMEHADKVLERARRCERTLTFSCKDHSADFWADEIRSNYGVVSFMAHTPSWKAPVRIPMPGLFNVDNALAAVAVAYSLGISQEQICERFFGVRVPGRMELILTVDRKVIGLVDYAHNKLSYQRFFPSVKEEFPGFSIIALFGCPGGKAYERRVELPQEAAKWSDLMIYTEEDPAHDPVELICEEMAANTPEGSNYEIIPNREEAVFRAVEYAYSLEGNAIVCLLAKGDETRQHEGDEFVPCRTDGDLFAEAVRKYAPQSE